MAETAGDSATLMRGVAIGLRRRQPDRQRATRIVATTHVRYVTRC